jgi:peptidyl-dipeptidase A
MLNRCTSGLFLVLLLVGACGAARPDEGSGDTSFRAEVRKYIARYEVAYQKVYTQWQEARWGAATHVVPGDPDPRARLIAAEQAFADFTGSIENIELSRFFLKRRKELVPVEQRELDRIAWLAAGSAEIVKDLVQRRIAADVDSSRMLHGFTYQIEGRVVTGDELDRILENEHDLRARRAAWDASKEPGRVLREPLVATRWLRNEIVRALGRRDFIEWRVSAYGLGVSDMMQRLDQILRDLRPLQVELHTWARYELARRYGQPVPDLIPAHWLPSRFGEDWSGLVEGGFDFEAALREAVGAAEPRAILERAERSWKSVGFDPLPASIWERSSLWPVPPDAGFAKEEGPSVWNIDLDHDVRAQMSIETDLRSLRAAHRVIGGIYWQLYAANPQVPGTLRRATSRALEDAIGGVMELAAEQPRFMISSGLSLDAPGAAPDPTKTLLQQALRYVSAVAWSAGTMTRFEMGIYRDNLPPEQWNARFWNLCAQYQGIAPPSPRDERWCDAAAEPGVIDAPGDAYDAALSCVLLFQLHDHIARKILDQDPHDTDYWGRREVGDILKSIMRFGATVDWRTKLREKSGSDLSARAMVEYFEPLRRWLVEQNQGRKRTL